MPKWPSIKSSSCARFLVGRVITRRSKISYLCGSGTHPGGGVTGLPGYYAAKEILKNRSRQK